MQSDGAGERAGEREMLARLREAGADFDVAEARRMLRSPYVTGRVISELLERRELLRSSELRREVAGHPRTPEVPARRLVATLYWRDLVELSRDPRVRPVVRRGAEVSLGERLPGLSVGERIAIARRAGGGVVARLRFDPSPPVIAALLENPRLTEPMLGPLLASERVPPQVLEVVARDRRWGSRYGVRLALCRNPRTPEARVLGLLPSLRKSDLRAVARDPRLPSAVRRRAQLMVGEEPRI
ncbi:MAG: hypothetical protein R3325_07085 [Thermoanaerobaculia bacterium]|nr:hypothetical protein [Thermoanaerobaculia bacterium]